jgi:hypothetical protein
MFAIFDRFHWHGNTIGLHLYGHGYVDSMNWEEALEIVVSQTGHERYRWLCSDENQPWGGANGRDAFRRLMMSKAGQPYPPLATQARSFLASVRDFIKSGAKIADRAERARRRAICQGCERLDVSQQRCRACGCSANLKPWLMSATCPLDPPKW